MKMKFGNNNVEGVINLSLGDFLMMYFEENLCIVKVIVCKLILVVEVCEVVWKVWDDVWKRKLVLGGYGLLGKFWDCLSNKVEECEFYLVEGDLVGGSVEGGRLKEF